MQTPVGVGWFKGETERNIIGGGEDYGQVQTIHAPSTKGSLSSAQAYYQAGRWAFSSLFDFLKDELEMGILATVLWPVQPMGQQLETPAFCAASCMLLNGLLCLRDETK